jgi:hypothetical protein
MRKSGMSLARFPWEFGMYKNSLRCLAIIGMFAASGAFAEDPPILNAGDAVVTGFSGVVEAVPPDPVPPNWVTLDETLSANQFACSARLCLGCAGLAGPGRS